MRAREDAILVGTNTAEKDDPSLTVRHCAGKNPIRVLVDKKLRLPNTLNLFDGTVKTLVFNQHKNEISGLTEYVKIDFSKKVLSKILQELYSRNILSLIVEGGKQLLESFIRENLWDEAHIYTGNKHFRSGVLAPKISGKITTTENIENDVLTIFINH